MITIFKNLMISFMVLLVLLLFVPKLFGWQEYIVKSGSMEPSIKKGSIVYLDNVKFEEIGKGDIIGYQNGMDLIVHRVTSIDIDNQQLQTKGDANSDFDDYSVHASLVVGKMLFSLPLLGYLVYFFKTIPGFIILVFLILGIVITSYYENVRKENYEENNC